MTARDLTFRLNHGFQILFKRVLSISTLLTLLWCLLICWGERWTFQSSIRDCQWHLWETWPPAAIPHHVVLIADPQLVDPHTYPDRPWPLSSLTIFYTDLYLHRSYDYIQDFLVPDSLFFLGDLFDGGREWGAPPTAERRYKKYGTRFWLKEYKRFVKLFLGNWRLGRYGSFSERRGRKIISSLPGNHDLGFANGISVEVKDRFDAYFGPLNRVDVVGNHTFVSLDTVSLSAMDQPDPVTGSSGMGDGTAALTAHSAIWRPVQEFLEDVQNIKYRALQHEADYLSGLPEHQYAEQNLMALSPNVNSLEAAPSPVLIPSLYTQHLNVFPNILLTHVPLFRPAGTDCGPLREHGTSLAIAAGFQYQNVLTPGISSDIITKLGVEQTAQVYSGDDHDYCEIEHGEFTGRIREITVKSMSWAMGVRHPGFQLVSLWNPINVSKHQSPAERPSMPKDTIQNHLCVLPDQLGIFIRYVQMLGLTLIILAFFATRSPSTSPFTSLFSTTKSDKENPKSTSLLPQHHTHDHKLTSCSQTSTNQSNANTYHSTHASLRVNSKPRLPSPSKLTSYSYSATSATADDNWEIPLSSLKARPTPSRTAISILRRFGRSVWEVAWPVLLFYLWVIWSG